MGAENHSSGHEYIVRELQPEDLDAQYGFFETLRNLTGAPDLPMDEALDIFDRIRAQGSYIFVAVTPENQIVGTATIFIEQKLFHSGVCAGHIEDVATRKGWERKGVGRAVVEAAVAKAREKDCYKVILDCKEYNVLFYEKLGFKKDSDCMRINLRQLS